jgi:molybdopterin adenylyltransferase
MSRDQHREQAGEAPVEAHIIVVSSSRTASTDRSGKLIADLLIGAGHVVGSRVVVDDDVVAIRDAVGALASTDAAVVILTGGTGITGRDVTPEALEPLLSPRLDGFGEAFRWLSFQEIGAAAILSRACAGLVGRTIVFAVPGSSKACQLAVERLITPDLNHLVHLARTDRAREDDEAWTGEDVSTAPFPTPSAPPRIASSPGGAQTPVGDGRARVSMSAEPDAAPSTQGASDSGWQRIVRLWGGTVHRDVRETLPESLERVAAVVDVLHRAGASASLELADGRRYSLWGFPDLVRPNAKVLAIRVGSPIAQVLALHRWPAETGTCVDGDHGHTPSRSSDPVAVAERLTGRRPPGEVGPLFAVAGNVVYFERDRKILRWDGTRERDEGTPNQVLASLVLDWSQR